MRTQTKVMAPEVLLEQYSQLLKEEPGLRLPLVVSGDSMSPFLIPGRDTVYLTGLQRPPRRGDILLYRRDSGAYILHRVWKTEQGMLTMLGDAQQIPEPGIRPDQILAVVCRVERKGRLLVPGCFWWDVFEKLWIRVVPARRVLHGVYSIFRKKR